MKPSHIALIPDGNRRWAKENRKSLVDGYLAGIDKVGEVMEWGRDCGLKELTFWGLSTENLARNKLELRTLMKLFDKKFRETIDRNDFHENGVKFRVFGNRSLLPSNIQTYIARLEASTQDYSNHFVNILLGYGGRQELIAACNAVITDYEAGHIRKVDEKTFSRYLYTNDLSDPDLIIRTSGEQRLSGFLPWHSAYSEFYFSKSLWPDFGKTDLEMAIGDFSERKRRFGR